MTMAQIITKKKCSVCHEHLGGFAVIDRDQVAALASLRDFEKKAWIGEADQLAVYYSWLVSEFIEHVVEDAKDAHEKVKFCPFCGAPIVETDEET